jgi:hypothetical protein
MRYVVAVAGSAAVLLVGLASSASARGEYRWPPSEQRGFILACMSRGNPGYVCTCKLRWLEKRYGFARISYIYMHRPLLLARIIDRAVAACPP